MADREKVVRAVETCFDSWIDKHRNMGLDLHEVERMKRDALKLLQAPEIVRCEDCIYFEIKDFWGEFNGIPVLGASNQPTCTKWGDGDCKTSPDGYCFLAERR